MPQSEKLRKVFVSSTYIDLIEHRKAVEEAVNRLGEHFMGMEYFGSRPEEPKTVCLGEIEECDIFVGIYAHRYGFIPDGNDKSITEQEFDHARKLGKPCFCYRVDGKHPWSPEFIEHDKSEKLRAFLKRIEANLVRDEFNSPVHLGGMVAADLGRWLKEREAISTKEKPSVTLPPCLAHPYPLQKNFTGRKAEREMLTDWFNQDTQPMLAMIAFGGMGKSSLAWYWLHNDVLTVAAPFMGPKAGKAPEGVIWWSFYDDKSGFDSFLNHVLKYVSNEKVDPKSYPSAREKMEYLSGEFYKRRFLLVLDGVERVLRAYASLSAAYQGDEVKEDERGDFRSCPDPNLAVFLKNLAAGNLKTLLTSRLFPRELDNLAGCERHNLKRLSLDDTVDLFHREGIEGNRGEIDQICTPLGYHPLSLRLLIGLLKEDPEYQGRIEYAKNIDIIRDGLDTDLKEGEKLAHLLTHIYDRLPPKEQNLLSRFAAFRTPMDYQTLKVVQPKGKKREFKSLIQKLVQRGLILLNSQSHRYNFHPLVRKYSYERLTDKSGTHARLRDYFANVPAPKKIESVEDLNPVIELYHHTVSSGRFDKALELFIDRLEDHLYYTFGNYQLCIELLSALFPDGEDNPPRIKKEAGQAWTLNELAISYSSSGQPSRSVTLKKGAVKLCEKVGDKMNQAVYLGNMVLDQMSLGELEVAGAGLLRSIELCREIGFEVQEAFGYQELGRLQAYQGEFEQAKDELTTALGIFENLNEQQWQGVTWACHSLVAILQNDYPRALEAANKARELANVKHYERDIIQAEWLLGAAYRGNGKLSEAEIHLHEALTRCRRINLVELEADILLELAWLRRDQAIVAAPLMGLDGESGEKLMNQVTAMDQGTKGLINQAATEEAYKLAREALDIADRCEYRLQQADIHLFLARIALDDGDKNLARQEAEIARERASCGYKPTLTKAERFLNGLS